MKRVLAIFWGQPGPGMYDPVWDFVWQSAFPDGGSNHLSEWAIAALTDSETWRALERSARSLFLACSQVLRPNSITPLLA